MAANFEMWKLGKAQGNQFWGATHFGQYGIEVSIYRANPKVGFKLLKLPKIRYKFELILNGLKLFKKRNKYDILYCPYNGVNFFILLKAIGLYKKKIVLWQHQGLSYARSKNKRMLLKFMFKGIDRLYFFSPIFYEEACKSELVDQKKLKLFNWGPDLEFYNSLYEKPYVYKKEVIFVHNGYDSRDYDTLISAFNRSNFKLYLFLATKELVTKYKSTPNVTVFYLPHSPTSSEIAAKHLNEALVATICHKKGSSATGIIGLLEALALGKAIIATENEYQGIDIEKHGFGIRVKHYDVDGWVKAINILGNNLELAKQMGANARKFAEDYQNLANFSKQVAEDLKTLF